MDALGKAEDDTKNKQKSLEKIIFKSLKSLHPDLKLPKNNDGFEDFFQQYEQMYRDHCSEKEKATSEELENLRKENEDLKNQINEPKVNSQTVNVCLCCSLLYCILYCSTKNLNCSTLHVISINFSPQNV